MPFTPVFLIGQQGERRWIAVEVHGLGGAIFRSRAGAVRLVAEPLDLAIA